ncbi:MAG TPA: hypothetical protein VH020_13110 [Stellaceae bacterium]|jgi:hypothetical protein|nr:hypothetical protein [Stellaceae bacterium]
MDLRSWPRAHRQALILSAGAGAVVGVLAALPAVAPILNFHDCRALLTWLLNSACVGFEHRWFPLLEWPCVGGAVGAVTIYVWRLMKT